MTPKLHFESGRPVDSIAHCDECDATTLSGWQYCPVCGRELQPQS